MTQTYR